MGGAGGGLQRICVTHMPEPRPLQVPLSGPFSSSGCHGGAEKPSWAGASEGCPGLHTLPGRSSLPPLHLLEWLGRKWGVQPGRLLGTAIFYEFQWLFERAGHTGGQVGVGGGFTAQGVAAVPGRVFYGGGGAGDSDSPSCSRLRALSRSPERHLVLESPSLQAP